MNLQFLIVWNANINFSWSEALLRSAAWRLQHLLDLSSRQGKAIKRQTLRESREREKIKAQATSEGEKAEGGRCHPDG